MPDEEITTAQVADLLGIHRSKVTRDLVGRGILTPTKRLPGKTGPMLFSRKDVEALAALVAS